MKFLLDTHALIWFVEDDKRLSRKATVAIEDPQNQEFVSVASLWEIVIKLSKKKPGFEKSFSELYFFLEINEIEILAIDIKHLNALLYLPRYHDDPFDRVIIAQSITEKMTVISTDREFPHIPLPCSGNQFVIPYIAFALPFLFPHINSTFAQNLKGISCKIK